MITLPLEIKVVLTFLIMQGIKSVAKLFGKDVSGTGAAIVAVVVGAVVYFIEGVLGLVPADKVEMYSSALAFIAMLLGSYGTHYTYKSIGKNVSA